MKHVLAYALILLLTACTLATTDPCPDGQRDGGIGGTRQCEPAVNE